MPRPRALAVARGWVYQGEVAGARIMTRGKRDRLSISFHADARLEFAGSASS